MRKQRLRGRMHPDRGLLFLRFTGDGTDASGRVSFSIFSLPLGALRPFQKSKPFAEPDTIRFWNRPFFLVTLHGNDHPRRHIPHCGRGGLRRGGAGGIPAPGRECAPYREYLARIGVRTGACADGGKDPVPADRAVQDANGLLRRHCARSGLHSSATTGHDARRATRCARWRSTSRRSARHSGTFYGEPHGWSLYALLPNYLRRKGSSLVYMADRLVADCGSGGFYLDDCEGLLAAMRARPEAQDPAGRELCAVGPGGAVRSEAGRHGRDGDGRHEGIPRGDPKAEFHKILCDAFGVDRIHSEYGMAELTSQAYSQGGNIFRCPAGDAGRGHAT